MKNRIKLTTLMFAVTMLANSTMAKNKSCHLEVHAKEIHTQKGKIHLALYNKEHKDFPNNDKLAVKSLVSEIKGDTVDFQINAECGKYAIAVFHDVNGNNKLDVNMLGIPKEGYGFSNNPDAKFGSPDYSKAEFDLKEDQKITINLIYLY